MLGSWHTNHYNRERELKSCIQSNIRWYITGGELQLWIKYHSSGSSGSSGAPAGLASGAPGWPSAPPAGPARAPLLPLLPLLWYLNNSCCLPYVIYTISYLFLYVSWSTILLVYIYIKYNYIFLYKHIIFEIYLFEQCPSICLNQFIIETCKITTYSLKK